MANMSDLRRGEKLLTAICVELHPRGSTPYGGVADYELYHGTTRLGAKFSVGYGQQGKSPRPGDQFQLLMSPEDRWW